MAPTKLLADLREWEQRLDLMFDGKAVDALDYALAESLKVFPGKKQPYYDMIEVRPHTGPPGVLYLP